MPGARGDAASPGTLAAIALSSLFVGYVLPTWLAALPGAAPFYAAAGSLIALAIALARWGGRMGAMACGLGGAAGLALRLLYG